MSVNFAGQVPLNYPFNNRILFDANYITPNVALPAAGATANTNALNLLVATPFPTTETINVLAVIGAVSTNTANSKNCNVILQQTTANTDGTPNTTAWANIPTLGPVSATDNAGGGWAQANALFKLPPGTITQQFIRAQYALEANGGNASTGNGYLALVF